MIVFLIVCFSQTLEISELFLQIVLILKKNDCFMLQIHFGFSESYFFLITFSITWDELYIA